MMGTRITAREAMSPYGLGRGRFGTSRLDRLLIGSQTGSTERPLLLRWRLPRPLLLSLRNTFRRKGRLALTLTTLILGGAIFIAVFSVRASLIGTLDNWLSYFHRRDVHFDRDYRIERIRRETLSGTAWLK